jgi:hypothetical protein
MISLKRFRCYFSDGRYETGLLLAPFSEEHTNPVCTGEIEYFALLSAFTTIKG